MSDTDSPNSCADESSIALLHALASSKSEILTLSTLEKTVSSISGGMRELGLPESLLAFTACSIACIMELPLEIMQFGAADAAICSSNALPAVKRCSTERPAAVAA